MTRSLLILLSIFLVLVIISNYMVSKNREGFNDFYNGILPKENHTVRVGKLLYYNDPIFIHYGSKYIMLQIGKSSIGDLKDVLAGIHYLSPRYSKKGLTPIAYGDELYLRVYPDNSFNREFNKIFKIVPYTKPQNNQQPYVEMGDFISFVTKENEYLTVAQGTNVLELTNSKTVPDNGIFKLSNSPQCYINNKFYGADTRNSNITTIKIINDQSREYLDIERKKMVKNDEELRQLKSKEVQIKEEIMRLENSNDMMGLELSKLKEQYEKDIKKVRDDIEDRKIQIRKIIENNKQLAENLIDETYIKQMKDLLNKGCSK